MLGDLIDQPFDPAAVLDPLADRVVEGPGNVGANLPTGAGVEIECRMLLAPLAAAVGLAARAVAKHQRAAEKGLVGQELSGAGTRVSLLDGVVSREIMMVS